MKIIKSIKDNIQMRIYHKQIKMIMKSQYKNQINKIGADYHGDNNFYVPSYKNSLIK